MVYVCRTIRNWTSSPSLTNWHTLTLVCMSVKSPSALLSRKIHLKSLLKVRILLHSFDSLSCRFPPAWRMRYLSCPGLAGEMRLVTGPPVIRKLIKQRGEDGQHKILVCEAEGSPKPSVSWSINGTLVCNAHTHTHTLSHTHTHTHTPHYRGRNFGASQRSIAM